MIDIKRLRVRFRQFGGWRLVLAYARMGVLSTGFRALAQSVLKGRSLKWAYDVLMEQVDKVLMSRYRPIIDEAALRYRATHQEVEGRVPRIVWFCWLQGMDQAPDLVKACLKSQQQHLPDYEFRVLDLSNYRQWVELPEYIVSKYAKGRIPSASFSDMLRLAVLQTYGGIWMDASVFCSGFGNEKLWARWDRIERSELTIFRYFRRGRQQPTGLSNWFIATRPHHVVVSAIYDVLLSYWRDYDCTVDYYMMHLFLRMALDRLPELEAAMPRENSYHSILLGDALGRNYDEAAWQDLIAHVSIHKMNYRKAQEVSSNPNSYYWKLVKGYC